MKKVFDLIDGYLMKFVGLDKQAVTPDEIKVVRNQLLLVNTESHKRHTYTQALDQFLSENIEKLDENAKEKLGISVGKSLAKNLVVSFEKVTITKEDNYV